MTATSTGRRGLRTGNGFRDNVATLLVSGVSALFGVALIEATAVITGAVAVSAGSSSGTVAIALGTVSAVFLLLAVYVGAVVTSNTFATIVAGRRRSIALLRVLGAESSRVRRSLAAEGLVVGEDAEFDKRWFRRTDEGVTLVTQAMIDKYLASK